MASCLSSRKVWYTLLVTIVLFSTNLLAEPGAPAQRTGLWLLPAGISSHCRSASPMAARRCCFRPLYPPRTYSNRAWGIWRGVRLALERASG